MATIREIQQTLSAKGFDPGEIDGVWGRRSIRAVRAFQAANGLTADGIVGPKTLAKLLGDAAVASAGGAAAASGPAVWFEEAKRLLGVREGQGALDNPKILDWADDLDINFPHDEIPWCGLFVAHCVGATLPDEPLPANPLGARNWARFGTDSPAAPGAILVFWRETPNSGKGHVGFYHSEDGSAYNVLGGNQSNQVSIARVAKSRLLAIRRPSTAGKLGGGPVAGSGGGGLSTNEA